MSMPLSQREREDYERLKAEREAFQNNTQVLTCVFCGHRYPPGTPPSNHAALVAHIKVCAKHPLFEVIQVLTELHDAVEQNSGYTCNTRLTRALQHARQLVGSNA
jgi:hypothetical protein